MDIEEVMESERNKLDPQVAPRMAGPLAVGLDLLAQREWVAHQELAQEMLRVGDLAEKTVETRIQSWTRVGWVEATQGKRPRSRSYRLVRDPRTER